MATLGKAHISAVDRYEGAGGYTLQHEVHLSPLLFDLKSALIDTAWIVIRHVRLIRGVRIVDIGIVGILIAENLPTGGHLNGVPFLDGFRHIDISVKIGEVPRSVQQVQIAAVSGRWCGVERPRCGASGRLAV